MAAERTSAQQKNKRSRRQRIGRAIGRTAPELARALGGPLAGAAVSALAEAVLGDAEADENVLEEVLISGKPEIALQLREAEIAFHKALWEARIQSERIAADDRASARAREAKVRDWTPSAMGIAVILGFFVVLAIMFTSSLPEGAEKEFAIMLGALATMTAAVVNYFFGSSAGSKEKTQLLRHGQGRLPDDNV